jgi:hypothetical protein
MVTALGGFSGELDDSLQLKDAVAFVPTDGDGLTAKSFRVRILDLGRTGQIAKVAAIVQTAPGILARNMYPQFDDLWDILKNPNLSNQIIEGEVKPVDVPLDACLPEIEHCPDSESSRRLPIEPPVPSVGFIVKVSITFKDDFKPGMTITGLVALDDEEPASKA